jgi:predicted  nucleic acid-binding Zn-ribbon protein
VRGLVRGLRLGKLLNMSPDLDRLITLQHLDAAIADARQKIASHPERLAEADARLGEARASLDAVKTRLGDNQEARRTLEKEVAMYQGRLSKFRDQQAAVKTNKEYQALGHEIETAQHELGAVEEKVIAQMVDADAIAVDVKQAEAAFAVRQKEIDAEKKALEAERTDAEATLARTVAEREAVVGGIDRVLLDRYEHIARARKGQAICPATREGLCSACHVRLRPHVFQQVRANDQIIQCDSCQRILYWVPPPAAVDAGAVIRTS